MHDTPIDRTQLRVIANLVAPMSTAAGVYVVGIDGRGGAGKSTFAQALADEVGGNVPIVHMDDFYLPAAGRPAAPVSFTGLYDRERLVRCVLAPLSEGRDARYRRYDWHTDELAEWHELPADGVVIVEGITAMAHDLRPWLDLGIWVDTPSATCLQRGIERDGEASRSQWEELWIPAETAYIDAERPARHADIVVSGADS